MTLKLKQVPIIIKSTILALNGKQNSGTYSTDIHTNITALNAVSGVNTGDETITTIKSKLGISTLSGSNSGDNAVNTLYSGLATSKQDLLVSGTSIKTINGNSLLGSGDITIIAGESTPITGTVAIAMGNEESSKIITINDSTITLASLKEYAFINIETSETSLDDFTLNGLSFGIENIVDNVSFDIRANATNNASGNYTIKYIITI